MNGQGGLFDPAAGAGLLWTRTRKVFGFALGDFVVMGVFVLINLVTPRVMGLFQTFGFADPITSATLGAFIEVLKHVVFQQFSIG